MSFMWVRLMLDHWNTCASLSIPGRLDNDNSSAAIVPILPYEMVRWYYNNSAVLEALNPSLSQTILNRTCPDHFECIHDYIVRVNPFTSGSTALALDSIQVEVAVLGRYTHFPSKYVTSWTNFIWTEDIPPTITVESPIRIPASQSNSRRNYSVPIIVSGTNTSTVVVTVFQNSTSGQNTSLVGSNIIIPVPTDSSSFVEVLWVAFCDRDVE